MHNKSHPVFFSSIYRMAFTVLPCALDDTSAFFVLFFLSYSFLLEITYVSGGPYLPFMNYGVIRYAFGGLASLLLISFCFVLLFC